MSVGGFPHPRAGYFCFAKSNQKHCSDAPAFGFPAILANTGQRANSLCSDMRAADPVLAAFLGDA